MNDVYLIKLVWREGVDCIIFCHLYKIEGMFRWSKFGTNLGFLERGWNGHLAEILVGLMCNEATSFKVQTIWVHSKCTKMLQISIEIFLCEFYLPCISVAHISAACISPPMKTGIESSYIVPGSFSASHSKEYMVLCNVSSIGFKECCTE